MGKQEFSIRKMPDVLSDDLADINKLQIYINQPFVITVKIQVHGDNTNIKILYLHRMTEA